jgi:hypothetical protein
MLVYELGSNSLAAKYKNCFKKFLGQAEGTIAFTKVFNDPDSLKSLGAVTAGFGMAPMKRGGEDITEKSGNVEEIVDNLYKALEGVGTGQPLLDNTLALLKGSPKLTRAVEKRFDKKYGKTWDTLRNGLENDLSWGEEDAALAIFAAADKALGKPGVSKKADAAAEAEKKELAGLATALGGAPTAGGKCDLPPMTPGCTGKLPAFVYKILYLGAAGFKEKISKEEATQTTAKFDEKLQTLLAAFQKQSGIEVKNALIPDDQTDAALTKIIRSFRKTGRKELEESTLRQQKLRRLNEKLMRKA